jgi:colanic acid biosynthesis glycosyl transferase WcaI
VIAEGPGADWLREQVANKPKKNLQILPFQPFSMMPTTLGSSDVLIVLLEADAGEFCVPSKTLTYMRAARPILGGMPLSNLASQIVTRQRMGHVVEPHDVDGFVAKGLALIDNPAVADEMGANAKAYADTTFDLELISTRFEMLMQAVQRSATNRTPIPARSGAEQAPKAGVS